MLVNIRYIMGSYGNGIGVGGRGLFEFPAIFFYLIPMIKKENIDLKAKWYDYFFLLRPILWVPVWVFLFLGYAYGARLEFMKIHLLLPRKFWFVLIAFTMLMSSVYVINQIVDKESDRINEKLFLIPYEIISVRSALIVSVLLALSALILSYFLGGFVLFLLFFVSLVLGLLYSLPPFHFKARPFLDFIVNGLGYACVALLVGWYTTENLNLHALVVSFGYFILVCAIFINTTIPDIPGDKKTGKITTGVFLGNRLSLILSSSLFILALIYAFLEMDLLVVVPSLLGAIFSILALWDNTEDMIITKLSYRVPSFIFILLVSIKFPIFLVINLVLLFVLRKYYKTRFGLDYPAMLGR